LHEASFRKALKANLKIVFGTDIGGIPWQEPIAEEFKWMVKFGMTPAAAIQAATSRPAEMLGSKGDLGVVAEGAYADIIAVGADPLKEIGELEKVKFVMKDGAVFKDDFHSAPCAAPGK
jgi:imidazolonepropionase-like amidohydrolase